MSKPRNPLARTPKGVAIYPKLNEPDTKYSPAGSKGTYSTKLAFQAGDPELDAFIAAAVAVRDKAYDERAAELVKDGKAGLVKLLQKAPVGVEEMDPATGETTGRIILNVKMNAGGIIKNGPRAGQPWDQKPDYFTAAGAKLVNPPKIGGGSLLKANVELDPYFVEKDKTIGVTLRLKAIQIITLVVGGSRSFADHGFGAEDGDDIEDQAPDTGGFNDESASSANTAGNDDL